MICLAFNKSSSRWLICVGHWQYVPISVKTQVWILLQDIWHDTFIWINPIPYISIYIGHLITPDPSKNGEKHAISILHLTYLTRIYTNKRCCWPPMKLLGWCLPDLFLSGVLWRWESTKTSWLTRHESWGWISFFARRWLHGYTNHKDFSFNDKALSAKSKR